MENCPVPNLKAMKTHIWYTAILILLFSSANAQELLAYDDDHPDQRIANLDQYLAVKMSPAGEGRIVELQFDLLLEGERGQFEVLLFDWVASSPSTTPVYGYVAEVQESGLFRHQVTPPIPFSGEFLVGFRSLDRGLKLGADAEANGRGWMRSVAIPTWTSSDQTYFIRAVVESDSRRESNSLEMPDPSDDVIVIGTDGTISKMVFLDSNGVIAHEQDLRGGVPIEVAKLVPGPYLLLLYSGTELISTERVFIR